MNTEFEVGKTYRDGHGNEWVVDEILPGRTYALRCYTNGLGEYRETFTPEGKLFAHEDCDPDSEADNVLGSLRLPAIEDEMKTKFEVGKTYVDNSGEMVKIIEINDHPDDWYPVKGMRCGERRPYCLNGNYYVDNASGLNIDPDSVIEQKFDVGKTYVDVAGEKVTLRRLVEHPNGDYFEATREGVFKTYCLNGKSRIGSEPDLVPIEDPYAIGNNLPPEDTNITTGNLADAVTGKAPDDPTNLTFRSSDKYLSFTTNNPSNLPTERSKVLNGCLAEYGAELHTRFGPNSHGHTEYFSYVHAVGELFDRLCHGHPTSCLDDDIFEKTKAVEDALAELYQSVGRLETEE